MNMGGKNIQQISKLIELLKVNDEKNIYIAKKVQEPKEAINALIRIGAPAVEPLLNLLRDNETWSVIYTISILEEIGDARAVEPLIKLLDAESFFDESICALQRIGLPALEPTLSYLKEKKEKKNDFGILCALEVIKKIKDEKAFNALVDALSYPEYNVQESAVASLGSYGDKRALKFLIKLFDNPDIDRDELKYSIRKLASPQEYRSILAEHGIIGMKRITSLSNSIRKLLRTMENAYEFKNKFEGDYAEKLNEIALDHKIKKSMEDLLWEVIELAVDEAVISNEIYEQLHSIMFRKLSELHEKFEKEYEEEICMINREVLDPLIKEEIKFYKGLALESRWAEHPILDALCTKIWDWLKRQNFQVVHRKGVLWGRKGKKDSRKGCSIDVGKDFKRRIWGYVSIYVWGNAWTEKEAETFTQSLWEFVENSGLAKQS